MSRPFSRGPLKIQNMPSKCTALLASKLNRFLCIRFSLLLIIVGFGLLIYYGITEVLPAAKARHFRETSCFVNYSAVDGEEVCDCGAGFPLSSCYPCLKIHVEYRTENNGKACVNVSTDGQQSILYEDVSSVSDKCSFRPPSCCSRSKEENQQQVRNFKEKKGRNGSRIICYYNKFNHTQVIATRGDYQLMTFMSLFWPLLVVISGFSLMKYVKHLQPVKMKKTATQDRKRILVLSTLSAFLRAEGQPAVYHSHTVPGFVTKQQSSVV